MRVREDGIAKLVELIPAPDKVEVLRVGNAHAVTIQPQRNGYRKAGTLGMFRVFGTRFEGIIKLH